MLLRRRRLITMTVHERYLLQVPKRRTTNNVDDIIDANIISDSHCGRDKNAF